METGALVGKFIHEYRKGETICEEGSSGHEMYIIVSGAVRVTTVTPGRENVMSLLGPGEFFGEMALVDGAPRSGTAVAGEDTRLVELDLNRFLYLIQQQPAFALTIMRTLCDRIRRRDALYLDLLEKGQVP
ncbi:MAG: cyclic nucleotide-binding domain-containing protein [Deltaproteobacteria bacterium]|nr:cyclic nucleotide-binding domain-containing protein [Deltaproteobacteria bacterium]